MATSDLYTGVNSGSFGNYRATKQREEIVKEKREKKSLIFPAHEVINEFIDKEIANVSSLESLLVDSFTPEPQLVSELQARRLYIAHLRALKSHIGQLLRETKR